MRQLFASLRRRATCATLVILAGWGASACRLATPSPVDGRVATAVRELELEPLPPPPLRPYLVLRLAERRLYVVDDDPGTQDQSFPIAVGRKGLETPVGRFQVEEKVENPDYLKFASGVVVKRIPPGPTNPLGERWIGFVRGDGWTIGIHGTPNPELLGKAVSHGCVRMRNADVVGVYERVQIGTPVVVEP
jgi:lipoprotein-anchoring transpeptidase ErfK/SrfK